MMLDIVIIGAGPVGLYASTLASLHNLKGIVLESRDLIGGQLTNFYPQKDIIDLAGINTITAGDFIDSLVEQNNTLENKLDIHSNETLLSFEKKDDGYLIKTNLTEYQTRTLLIVSGMGKCTPRKMKLDGEDNFKNIYYSVFDKEDFRDKNVVIMGGGDSAVDMAMMLQPVAKSVKIVHRRLEFRAQSSSVSKMKEMGVEAIVPFVGKELVGTKDKLTKIIIKNKEDDAVTRELDADALIVSYGMVPGVNDFDLDMYGRDIKVFESYMTSKENIFAVGNVINYPGKVKNITCGLGEAVVAITKIDQIIHPGKNIPIHF